MDISEMEPLRSETTVEPKPEAKAEPQAVTALIPIGTIMTRARTKPRQAVEAEEDTVRYIFLYDHLTGQSEKRMLGRYPSRPDAHLGGIES